ncbi:competence type IV pilus assembly protein ComGB [Vagococcus intermedius]|uniref:Competence type IV pilus assembly protein ComGB n=1 Tax=Vagococcus intermedius TaxID=2991418 RepID=A0AAF0CVA5_9ENTE|nr:competence type IV pilus assembly protein ComGB [Vagococcus intermedius]WEG73512.1 competence type IV pilus assembly protein ComGB [Vagococcus intermedius]WEG75594.1 competence type IV pilus assembly protein ComGB [Vagococcus intermedius]
MEVRWNRQARFEFVELLGELLVSGFTMQESLAFMKDLLPKHRQGIDNLLKNFSLGEPIHKSFASLGYTDKQVTQLYLASVHGDLIGTLTYIAVQTKDERYQREQLLKVLAYPLLLITFLVGMMLLMRYLLVPQLTVMTQGSSKKSHLLEAVTNLPFFLGGVGGFLALLSGLFYWQFKRNNAIKRSTFYSRIPGISKFYCYYYTSFFANEWGMLLKHGLELQAILRIMQVDGNAQLMIDVSKKLDKGLAEGHPLYQEIANWSFFTKEFATIIHRGEVKGKLGDELVIYSKRLWQELNKRLERVMLWIQPVTFIIVAGLILVIYGALLLPIYQEMDEML